MNNQTEYGRDVRLSFEKGKKIGYRIAINQIKTLYSNGANTQNFQIDNYLESLESIFISSIEAEDIVVAADPEL